MKSVPKLRFSGFEDEWKEKKLGGLLEFKNGINADKEAYGQGIKFINVLDILSNNYITADKIIGKIDIDEDTLQKYSVNYGDVLFQRSSETREEVGTANVYLGGETVTFGGFVIRGKKIGEYEPAFMNSLLKSKAARKEITTKSGGSTRYNVGQEILSAVELKFPSLSEQRKIADFLSNVDKSIENQYEKISNLDQYKKGMMQKIFSQEIRFKKNDGGEYPEWEEIILEDVLSIPLKIKCENPDKNKLLSVKLHLQGVKENTNVDTLSIGSTSYYVREAGQFIYGKQNFFNGAFGIIPKELDGYLSSGDIPALDINRERINDEYLLGYLSRRSFYKKTENLSTGTGSKRIHEKTLLEVNIELPCLEEQSKIAKFLSKIDSIIQKEKEKLEELRQWKKGLLQQMFV